MFVCKNKYIFMKKIIDLLNIRRREQGIILERTLEVHKRKENEEL